MFPIGFGCGAGMRCFSTSVYVRTNLLQVNRNAHVSKCKIFIRHLLECVRGISYAEISLSFDFGCSLIVSVLCAS